MSRAKRLVLHLHLTLDQLLLLLEHLPWQFTYL